MQSVRIALRVVTNRRSWITSLQLVVLVIIVIGRILLLLLLLLLVLLLYLHAVFSQ